ncbi:MAG TPA: plastocyanin/azurin family copper-binding protein [Thermoleophilaceae bacterium]|jgi:plastocyanin
MRRLATAVPAALCLALAAPAGAADQTVHATPSNTFTPATVTIGVGESVTWVNDGGFHNVKFDDGSFEQPGEPAFNWSTDPKRTFSAPGSFRYFCEQHGSAGGGGMSGTVVVQQPQGPGGGEQPDTTAPDVDDLRIVPSTFCNRKTKACKKTGALIRFTIDEDAKISGRIVRRKDGKKVGSLSITARAGEGKFDLAAKGLALGKYRLELTPRDAAGNRAKASRANFTIATKRR